MSNIPVGIESVSVWRSVKRAGIIHSLLCTGDRNWEMPDPALSIDFAAQVMFTSPEANIPDRRRAVNCNLIPAQVTSE